MSETSIEQLKEAIKQLVDETRSDGEQDTGDARQQGRGAEQVISGPDDAGLAT